MIKTYISSGVVSFPLTIGTGYRRIRFVAKPLGGAIYTTSDVKEQEALEKHEYMGRLYTLESVIDDEPKQESKVANDLRTVVVSDIDEAKDYLVTNYGYASSNLRSKKAIYDAAEAQGITFEGI